VLSEMLGVLGISAILYIQKETGRFPFSSRCIRYVMGVSFAIRALDLLHHEQADTMPPPSIASTTATDKTTGDSNPSRFAGQSPVEPERPNFLPNSLSEPLLTEDSVPSFKFYTPTGERSVNDGWNDLAQALQNSWTNPDSVSIGWKGTEHSQDFTIDQAYENERGPPSIARRDHRYHKLMIWFPLQTGLEDHHILDHLARLPEWIRAQRDLSQRKPTAMPRIQTSPT
jgi:hypothetical protein